MIPHQSPSPAAGLRWLQLTPLVLALACGGGGGSDQPPAPAPASIASFGAAKTTITTGTSATLNASFSNGSGLVTPGNLAIQSGVPLNTGSLTSDTTFTLTVTGTTGVPATAITSVHVVAAPDATITGPSQVPVGASGLQASVPSQPGCTFAWTIAGGTITAGDGTNAVTFTAGTGTTLTLSCAVTNAAGTSASATRSLEILHGPTITSFSASRSAVNPGETTQLTAVFSNGTASVNQGIGAIQSGIPVTTSALAATTTFTLTAVNASGTTTADYTVLVVPPPVIQAFQCTNAPVLYNTPASLLATFIQGVGSIDQGLGAVQSGTPASSLPLKDDTTFTLSVINPAGKAISQSLKVPIWFGYFDQNQGGQGGFGASVFYDKTAIQPTPFNWTRQSRFLAPQRASIKWRVECPDAPLGQADARQGVAIGSDGTLYMGFLDQKDGVNDLCAFDPATGAVLKRFSAKNGWALASAPVLAADGTIYQLYHDLLHNPAGGELVAFRSDGSIRWRCPLANLGSFWNPMPGPALAPDGTIYVATGGTDGDYTWQICALDPGTGALKWQFHDAGDTAEEIPMGPLSVGADGTVYATLWWGNLLAVKPDGTLKWRSDKVDVSWGASPVLAKNGTLYVPDRGHVTAVDPATGEVIWTHDLGGEETTTPVLGADGTLYVGSGAKLYAIDPAKPDQEKWSFTAPDAASGVLFEGGAPLLSVDGILLAGTSIPGATFQSNPRFFYAIRADGTLLWSLQVPLALTPPDNQLPDLGYPVLDARKRVFIGTGDGSLLCLGE